MNIEIPTWTFRELIMLAREAVAEHSQPGNDMSATSTFVRSLAAAFVEDAERNYSDLVGTANEPVTVARRGIAA